MGKSPQRKSRKVPCLITRMSSTQQVRWDPYVDQNPQIVACWHLQKLEKIEQERWDPYWWIKKEEHDIDFIVPGLSHAVVKEAEHLRVQEIESHPHREALQADLQQNNVYNHSATIRRRWSANWVMWSYSSCAKHTKSTMFSLSSLLESRNCVLYLRTMLDWQRIQKKISKTKTGCTLYPELRDKERTQSWCSTSQNLGSKRVPYGLECVEEILQESLLSRWTINRYSRSIPQRSRLLLITTRNRMDRTKVQMVGRTCTRRPYISSHSRGKKISRTMSAAILAQAISCSNVHGVFPFHERFWFSFVQVSTAQFCCFHLFSWHVRVIGRMCQFLRYLLPLRI